MVDTPFGNEVAKGGRSSSGSKANWITFGLVICLSIVQAQAEENLATPVSCAISVMLLGSITFQMLLFYLVNHPDEDIKRYSWSVISQTISIFCAVLTFQGVNGLVEEHVIEGGKESSPALFAESLFGEGSWEVVVPVCLFAFWLTALQGVLAVTSGAVGEEPEGGIEAVELNIKSYAVLMAHITGFASINAWGSIQQVYYKKSYWALVAMPIGFFGMCAMYSVFDLIRYKIANSDDGEVDEYEEKWDDETEEAENDVIGISLSFLVVQVLRFSLGGEALPNGEGEEEGATEKNHSAFHIFVMLFVAIASFVVAILVLRLMEPMKVDIEENKEAGKEPSTLEEYSVRLLEMANNFFMFITAWCCFFASLWFLSGLQFTEERALLLVALALFLSAVSFAFIFILDKLEDSGSLGSDSEQAIDLMIQGLGILVGFSWEQAFDIAVTVVATALKADLDPGISKLILSSMLVLIVFPAWRIYILKTEQELIAETTPEGKKKKKYMAFMQEHCDLFLESGTEENVLDYTHLKLKHKRRHFHGNTTHYMPGMKHLRVTAFGIKEIEDEHHDHKHGHGHGHGGSNDLSEKLLHDDDIKHISVQRPVNAEASQA